MTGVSGRSYRRQARYHMGFVFCLIAGINTDRMWKLACLLWPRLGSGSVNKPWQHRHRTLVGIDRDKAEHALDRLFATIGAHALDEHFDFDLEAGVAHLDDAADQFNDRTGRNRVIEINEIGGDRHQRQAAKTSSRNEL